VNYLDTCLVIYLVERNTIFLPAVEAAITGSNERFAISPLVKADCFVGPFRSSSVSLENDFVRAFSKLDTLPITEAIFIAAARLRATLGVKLPDALHLACAQAHGCSALWTKDDRLAAAAPGFATAIV
jgi:predicted nucleic acid-binding protein